MTTKKATEVTEEDRQQLELLTRVYRAKTTLELPNAQAAQPPRASLASAFGNKSDPYTPPEQNDKNTAMQARERQKNTTWLEICKERLAEHETKAEDHKEGNLFEFK